MGKIDRCFWHVYFRKMLSFSEISDYCSGPKIEFRWSKVKKRAYYRPTLVKSQEGGKLKNTAKDKDWRERE